MSVLEIVQVGHPTLREPTGALTTGELASPDTQRFIDDLIDTMRRAGGAGLAAPQVDDRRRIAVVEVAENRRYPYKPPIELTVLVNPSIEALDEEIFPVNEGCLSVPGLRGVVDRHVNVRVSYLDRDGQPRSEVRRGLSAGTFQHEVDHLDGVMFLDRVRDPTTFMTWEQFDRFHREQFERRARELVARVGS
jgi:peptide deformylase